jgi:hypothetical protein
MSDLKIGDCCILNIPLSLFIYAGIYGKSGTWKFLKMGCHPNRKLRTCHYFISLNIGHRKYKRKEKKGCCVW